MNVAGARVKLELPVTAQDLRHTSPPARPPTQLWLNAPRWGFTALTDWALKTDGSRLHRLGAGAGKCNITHAGRG